jgi:hypothetical protein
MRVFSSLESAFLNVGDFRNSPTRSSRFRITGIHSNNRMVSLFLSRRRGTSEDTVSERAFL